MSTDHRGNPTGRNHVPISRAAKREIQGIATASGGNMRNIPTDRVTALMESHGPDVVNHVFDAINNHGVAMRQKAYKDAQRREKISGLRDAVVGKVAPYRATAYEVERRYGGAEEGGWYYDAGNPVAHSRPYLTQGGARKAADRMGEGFPSTGSSSRVRNMSSSDMYDADRDSGADMYDYESGREYSSSGYNPAYDPDADYNIEVRRGKGKPYPETRPYYE
jgi:hypothetical protein